MDGVVKRHLCVSSKAMDASFLKCTCFQNSTEVYAVCVYPSDELEDDEFFERRRRGRPTLACPQWYRINSRVSQFRWPI